MTEMPFQSSFSNCESTAFRLQRATARPMQVHASSSLSHYTVTMWYANQESVQHYPRDSTTFEVTK